MYPPNMFRKVSYAAGANHAYAASSLHPGGLNALMGDGSVRFIKETIDSWPSTRSPATRPDRRGTPAAGGEHAEAGRLAGDGDPRGGEVIGDEAY